MLTNRRKGFEIMIIYYLFQTHPRIISIFVSTIARLQTSVSNYNNIGAINTTHNITVSNRSGWTQR